MSRDYVGLGDPPGRHRAEAIKRLAQTRCPHGGYSPLYCQPCKTVALPILEEQVEAEEEARMERRKQEQQQADYLERLENVEAALDYLFREGGPGRPAE
jgi:hypothetical protein